MFAVSQCRTGDVHITLVDVAVRQGCCAAHCFTLAQIHGIARLRITGAQADTHHRFVDAGELVGFRSSAVSGRIEVRSVRGLWRCSVNLHCQRAAGGADVTGRVGHARGEAVFAVSQCRTDDVHIALVDVAGRQNCSAAHCFTLAQIHGIARLRITGAQTDAHHRIDDAGEVVGVRSPAVADVSEVRSVRGLRCCRIQLFEHRRRGESDISTHE